jgi:hypothetical protein
VRISGEKIAAHYYSWGCMIFDSLIAIWFLAGAPALISGVPVLSR